MSRRETSPSTRLPRRYWEVVAARSTLAAAILALMAAHAVAQPPQLDDPEPGQVFLTPQADLDLGPVPLVVPDRYAAAALAERELMLPGLKQQRGVKVEFSSTDPAASDFLEPRDGTLPRRGPGNPKDPAFIGAQPFRARR